MRSLLVTSAAALALSLGSSAAFALTASEHDVPRDTSNMSSEAVGSYAPSSSGWTFFAPQQAPIDAQRAQDAHNLDYRGGR